ncbi:MAG: UDP-N-acetylglucosamine--N-acetylmuramyl-(pentapeptide) pyrophosphoryl-undecaprenol N-acetylglucosamine transferase, partial [Patescibacteria group bacterium]|nr:UDP-N-acetylglucosamine--N-acetylmuramyl-(pentapeptide) pyrophosphoryl-undecaprenol N-acetylglucosamine transferase [Patescibacteria group bacterium]
KRELKRISPDFDFFYIGPKDELSSILLSQEGIAGKNILAGKIRRYLEKKSVFQNLVDIFFKTPIGIFQSFFYIFYLSPDIIFSKGGYGSIPSVIAGWLLGTPIFLHESDSVPGLANKICSRLAIEVFTSFPASKNLDKTHFPLKKIISIGNPIRKEILNGSKEKGKKMFALQCQKPIILILGGSQGAQKINNTILSILPALLKNFEIIHQCGEKNLKQVKEEADVMIPKDFKKYYHLYSFLKEREIRNAYASADLIVSRAGAGAIFEISAAGKPSIIIPLPLAAQNHQIENAYAFAKNKATIVIEEENLTPHFFLEKLKIIFSDKEGLRKMSNNAKEFSRPKASYIIAQYIKEYLLKSKKMRNIKNVKKDKGVNLKNKK